MVPQNGLSLEICGTSPSALILVFGFVVPGLTVILLSLSSSRGIQEDKEAPRASMSSKKGEKKKAYTIR